MATLPHLRCSVPCTGWHAGARHRLCSVVFRAEPSESSSGLIDDEARLAQLEDAVRKKKRASGVAAPPRKIQIRGQETKVEETSNRAEWKEGQLFPEGFDNMTLGDKITELYLGRRGILFWANKAAYASVFIVIGGWVCTSQPRPVHSPWRLTSMRREGKECQSTTQGPSGSISVHSLAASCNPNGPATREVRQGWPVYNRI
ncbi:uncharacterized protein HaLaN_10008 [Haematococcus lacustris]|uniref:Uncharacterized protein n=1 Tax=Haematococcus lacustris TaxID=44745 RepID=A0A699YXV7_HAELA|nr:uncharacterized protein HaLaN_10008 [Haematococcus lacustris]